MIKDWWAKRLTKDSLSIDLIAEPSKKPQKEHNLNSVDSKMLEQELAKMLEKKVVEECLDEFHKIIFLMFVVVQKTKKRPVWDSQHINTFTRKEHFKMESLGRVREMILRTVLDKRYLLSFATQYQGNENPSILMGKKGIQVQMHAICPYKIKNLQNAEVKEPTFSAKMG